MLKGLKIWQMENSKIDQFTSGVYQITKAKPT